MAESGGIEVMNSRSLHSLNALSEGHENGLGEDEDPGDDELGQMAMHPQPFEGQTFGSQQELEKFIDAYGKSIGFQWRTRSSRKDARKIEVCAARYVCSKEGNHRRRGRNISRPQPTTKEGCTACISATKQSNNEWKINRTRLEHNHETTASSSGFLRRYRSIPPHLRYRLLINQRAGIGVRRTYSAFAVEQQSEDNLQALERDCRNYVRVESRQLLGGGDAQAAMEYFGKMQAENENFFYLPQVDEEGRLKNLFWADARSRAAYTEFGDVVSFDTTYKKNMYEMPFAPLVGVNHHGETILFGCALLLHEDIESFIWVFKTWVVCMGGCAPKTIITDQDAAMRNAIKEALPQTKHRWCIWHILKKFEVKLGKIRSNKEMHDDLLHVVYDTYDPQEFDREWAAFINRYALTNNEWITTLSKERDMWAPAYLNEHFWGGMQSTQRSEAINGYFARYFSSSNPIRIFVRQYDVALKEKIGREVMLDSREKLCRTPCVTKFNIEKVFQASYTSKKFRQFQEEALLSNHCIATRLSRVGSVICYSVVEKLGEPPVRFTFIVSIDQETYETKCGCKWFETTGIVCKHMIRVMDMHDVNGQTLPDKYILRRWRKDIVRSHSKVKVPYIDPGVAPDVVRYDELRNLFEPMSTLGLVDEQTFRIMKRGLERLGLELAQYCDDAIRKGQMGMNRSISVIRNNHRGFITNIRNEHNITEVTVGGLEGGDILDPQAITRRGRPQRKRARYTTATVLAQRVARQRRVMSRLSTGVNENSISREEEANPIDENNLGGLQTNSSTRGAGIIRGTSEFDANIQTERRWNNVEFYGPPTFGMMLDRRLNFTQQLALMEADAQAYGMAHGSVAPVWQTTSEDE